MKHGKPDDEHPLAAVACELAKDHPSVTLDIILAVVRQARADLAASGDPERILERAELILRRGREHLN